MTPLKLPVKTTNDDGGSNKDGSVDNNMRKS